MLGRYRCEAFISLCRQNIRLGLWVQPVDVSVWMAASADYAEVPIMWSYQRVIQGKRRYSGLGGD